MPKVNGAYKDNKKREILDAAARVLMKKTLYELNMTDVIKEAGISKGGIYLYYKDIDALIIDLMDREFKADNFRERIDLLFNEDYPMETVINRLLQLYAAYLKESSVLAGKLQFELTMLITQNRERALKIRKKVCIRETGDYFNQKMADIIISNLEEDPKSKENGKYIFNYVQCFLDGVLEVYALEKCYQFDGMHVNLDNMMQKLTKNVIQMIKDASNDR